MTHHKWSRKVIPKYQVSIVCKITEEISPIPLYYLILFSSVNPDKTFFLCFDKIESVDDVFVYDIVFEENKVSQNVPTVDKLYS